jgi:hypothetical protein
MKKHLMERFLRLKNLKFEDCTKRQKEILTKEKPKIWDLYQWNIG